MKKAKEQTGNPHLTAGFGFMQGWLILFVVVHKQSRVLPKFPLHRDPALSINAHQTNLKPIRPMNDSAILSALYFQPSLCRSKMIRRSRA